MTPSVADVFVGVMEPLQVMSLLLLKARLVQVKALLKVADVFSLLSTQTTMPQTRLAARTSR